MMQWHLSDYQEITILLRCHCRLLRRLVYSAPVLIKGIQRCAGVECLPGCAAWTAPAVLICGLQVNVPGAGEALGGQRGAKEQARGSLLSSWGCHLGQTRLKSWLRRPLPGAVPLGNAVAPRAQLFEEHVPECSRARVCDTRQRGLRAGHPALGRAGV